MKVYQAYCDPGHAWIKVKRSELEKLGLLDKISSFSYQKSNFVYLEEDSDLSIFCNALKERGIDFKIKSNHTNRQSKIRSYENFNI